MTESTVHLFVVREKHWSLAEKVRLIRQANRAIFTRPKAKHEEKEHRRHIYPFPSQVSLTGQETKRRAERTELARGAEET
jgi:hypothetical protein